MYEQPNFETGHAYHAYNRGVAKQPLYDDGVDYRLMLEALSFYLDGSPATSLTAARKLDGFQKFLIAPATRPLVEVFAFCLMPNHFHLVLRQLQDGGISTYLRRALNSFTRAYNTRHHRVGTMFQGTFRAVAVESDEQLLHLTRYVHLNPFVARLSDTPSYPWSSYGSYLSGTKTRFVNPSLPLQLAGGQEAYKDFVIDYADYARSIAEYKKLLIDEED